MAFFNTTLAFALFPHTKRFVHAEAMDVATRYGAWKWIISQVMDNVKDPQWQHADRVSDVGDIFRGSFPNGNV